VPHALHMTATRSRRTIALTPTETSSDNPARAPPGAASASARDRRRSVPARGRTNASQEIEQGRSASSLPWLGVRGAPSKAAVLEAERAPEHEFSDHPLQ